MVQDVRGGAPLKPLLAVLFALIAVAVLFAAGLAADRYGSTKPAAAVSSSPSPSPSKRPPGVGDAVRDGKFEFVVSRVDCSRTSIGIEHLKRTAKGKFCIVSLSVRDIAGDAQYFLGHAQKAIDADGTAYGNDEIAGVYVNRGTHTFVDKLKPGERVSGELVFDIPETARLTTLELHDSLLSGGVRVTLG